MIADLEPYPAMNDSGVPWLGEVPEHWRYLPGKLCYREKKVPNMGLKETTVLSLSYGKIVVKPVDKLHGLVPASFETYQIVDAGNIIVRPTDLQNDWNSLRFGLSRHRGVITSAYICLLTTDMMIKDYGHLLLHAYDLKKVFYGLGSGLRQNLDWGDFKYLPCIVPPLTEQAAIVRYLDYMERRIRRYIRAKQKLIKLLEEQKQAIIHHAVTRGLDPNVRLKPSGVEWLGDVPEHWEVRRLRNLADMRVSNVDKHTKDDELPVHLCNYVDVYKNERITNHVRFMAATATSEEITQFRLELNDVLITKDSESWNDIGVPSLVEHTASDLVCGYHLALLRPFHELMEGDYLFRAMQSPVVAYQFHVEANGVTRYGLSHTAIKSAWLPVPPLAEQSAIVRFLDEATESVMAAISHAHREIALLREYRIRLIADVVTGKLDVREVAARLPDKSGEPEPIDELDKLNGAEEDTADDLDAKLEEEIV